MFQSGLYRWTLESSACQQKPNEWISYLHFQVASLLSSVVNFNWKPLKFNTAPIGDFYRVKSKVLGHGVNGKVKQCVNKAGQKFALKVLKDDAKSRQEIELHWRAATCNNVVNIRYLILQLSTINNHHQLQLPIFA